MRKVFVFLFIAGLAAGVGYPWYMTNFSGHEIGSWPVYQRGGGFEPVTRRLTSADMPVRVLVDMTALAPPEFAPASTVLTLTASTEGRTVLAETLTFADAKPRDKGQQMRERVYRDEGGVISGADGDYTFVVGQGDAENIEIRAVNLILRGGAAAVDARVQPIGFAMAAFGLVGFVLASRRRRARRPGGQAPGASPETPDRPRWGRARGAQRDRHPR